MAEHNCPFFLPQRSSKLSTSTTTVQNECELKSAPICSPRRQFGAKLCEYVPLQSNLISVRFRLKCCVEVPVVWQETFQTCNSGGVTRSDMGAVRRIPSKHPKIQWRQFWLATLSCLRRSDSSCVRCSFLLRSLSAHARHRSFFLTLFAHRNVGLSCAVMGARSVW